MHFPSYKKNREQKLKELEQNLLDFRQNLQKLEKTPLIYHEASFLSEVAEKILELERHASELALAGVWKEGAHLICHILQNPWGAPFVTKTSLVEAAKIYVDEKPQKSTLYNFLQDLSNYKKTCQIPHLISLKLLSDELIEYENAA